MHSTPSLAPWSASPPPRHRGMVLVWMAILIVVFVGIVALAIDWGYAYWTSQKLQNAADAAALAGARQVAYDHDDARAQALAIAGANEAGGVLISLDENSGNSPSGDVVIGHYDAGTRVFTADDSSAANAVAVNARLTASSNNGSLGLIWGPIFGRDTTQITRWAIAVVDGPEAGDSVIALDYDDKWSFYMHGTGTLDLGGGRVQVNSNHNQAARMAGTTNSLIASDVNINGNVWFNGYTPPPDLDFNTQQPTLDDPYASLPAPPNGTTRSPPGKISNAGTYQPGYYPQGLSINGGLVKLNPGIYVLDNGFKVTGNVTLEAYGVMFYIKSGEVDVRGTSTLKMTPIPVEENETYGGIQFFQARNNTNGALFNGTGISGGSDDTENKGAGMFYFPNAQLSVGGTGDTIVDSLIAGNIEVFGTGDKKVTRGYTAPQGGDKVYLAE